MDQIKTPLEQHEHKQFLFKLGARVKQLRKDRGWSLEQTEEHGWKNWRHLQRIETGHKNVTISTLRKIATLYDTTLDELLKGLE